MPTYEQASRLAAKGFRVFPLKTGTKLPAIDDWPAKATTNPETIKTFWSRFPDANIGIATGSGIVVLDVDIKNGADGLATLGSKPSLPKTLCVETASGGFHYYFKADQDFRNSSKRLGAGLDTRGYNGYVVAPGSIVDGKPYRVLNAAPLADTPTWIAEGLAAKKEKAEAGKLEDRDTNIALAAAYLKDDAPLATEGAGGDHTTFTVAAKLRDYGLTPATAYSLMLSIWNDRCDPPWDPVDLQTKVNNAYKYSSGTAGSADAASLFDTVAPVQQAPAEPKKEFIAAPLSALNVLATPPRSWILENRFLSGYLTLTVAPGATGKSTFSMLEAVAVATNITLTGAKVISPGATWIFNTEDPLDELKRRMAAICLHNQIDPTSLSNVYLTSGLDTNLVLMRRDKRGRSTPTPDAEAIEAVIKQHNIKLAIFDPFVYTHEVDENDNTDIAHVARIFAGIAKRNACAIHLVHHTRKRNSDAALAADDARGAGALTSAVRIGHTMSVMSEREAESLNIPDDKRKYYVRLDGVKLNLTAPDSDTIWFEKLGVTLPSGDTIGVVQPADLSEYKQSAQEEQAHRTRLAASTLCNSGVLDTGRCSFVTAARALKNHESGAFAGQSQAQLKDFVATAFSGEGALSLCGGYRVLVINGELMRLIGGESGEGVPKK